jgi:positive regulator of sigma E activity
MTQKGVIVECDGKLASVRVSRSDMCSGCHKNSENGCVACSLFTLDKTSIVKAHNKVEAKEGDEVEIESSTGRVMIYALLVFVLPIMIALGLFLIFSSITHSSPTLFFITFSGLVLPFIVVSFILNRTTAKRQDLTVIRIVRSE